TLLSIAARMGRLNVMELLVRCGHRVDGRNEDGSTALHIAARFDRGKVIDFLLMHGADINAVDIRGFNAFQYSVSGVGCIRAMNRFLDAGVDINRQSIDVCASIFYSCFSYGISNTLLLVIRGADIHVRDATGCTLLWYVCDKMFYEKASVFLAFGVDVNATNMDGDRVIHSLLSEN
ncbi:ankyrin repeat-containing domain protein, partial [Baffinella frigidus]